MPPDRLQEIERAGEVNVDDFLPGGVGHLGDHRRTYHPGIVDQTVDRSPFLDAPRHRGLRERWIRDAARRGDDPVWIFCRERLETFGVPVDRAKLPAEFEKGRAACGGSEGQDGET